MTPEEREVLVKRLVCSCTEDNCPRAAEVDALIAAAEHRAVTEVLSAIDAAIRPGLTPSKFDYAEGYANGLDFAARLVAAHIPDPSASVAANAP